MLEAAARAMEAAAHRAEELARNLQLGAGAGTDVCGARAGAAPARAAQVRRPITVTAGVALVPPLVPPLAPPLGIGPRARGGGGRGSEEARSL